MSKLPWHLVSGEYPPSPGGVADYTFLVAEKLVEAGETVHVWTAGEQGTTVEPSGVIIHRVAGDFHRRGLTQLNRELDRVPGPRRLFIQYVPHTYDRRAMNLAFSRWVSNRRRAGDDVWTLFHEVYMVFELKAGPVHWVVSAVTHLMAREILRASSKVFVTIPDWEKRLRPMHREASIQWLPVPSTIPVVTDAPAVAAVRERAAANGSAIIGTFGTYGGWYRDQLRRFFMQLMEREPAVCALILGRRSDEFAGELIQASPKLADRIVGPGMLDPAQASIHLQACDIMIQPYPDGISSRRTSSMAALAHGKAIATTVGHLSEPIWAETGAVRLSAVNDTDGLVQSVEQLIANKLERERLAARGLALYMDRFAIERTVEELIRHTNEPSH